jgi:hypothetical protein
MYNAINPQLDELWTNAIAPGPMLKGLKSQLQAIVEKR